MPKHPDRMPAQRAGRRSSFLPAALCNVLGTVLIVGVILAFLPVPLAKLAGYDIYNIISGSMEPAIPIGSAILVRSVDPGSLAPGDVIAFERGGAVVAHRVVENGAEITTKGDANEAADPMPVQYSSVIGRVEHSLPGVGGLLEMMTSGAGRLYAVGLVLAGGLLRFAGGQLGQKAKAQTERSASEAEGAQQGAEGAAGEAAQQGRSAEGAAGAAADAAAARAAAGGGPADGGAAAAPIAAAAAPIAATAADTAAADGEAARAKKRRRLRRVLMLILAAVFLVSLGVLVGFKLQEWQRQSFYDSAAERFTDPTTTEQPAPETPPIEVDFEALLAVNPDIQGWIYCADTPIDYPVLYSENNDTYLRRDYEGNYSNAGSIFLEALNQPGFADSNTIVYGHNMRDGSMFAVLKEWADPAFAEAHQDFWLLTPEQNYKVQVFSAHDANALDSSVYSIFQGPSALLNEYLANMAALSDFTPHGQLPADGKYLLLSTCTDAVRVDMERYVLHAWLEPVG